MTDNNTPKANTLYKHKKEHYLVNVLEATQYGKTQFRRVVALNPKAGNPLRKKKTHYFLYEFEEVTDSATTLETQGKAAYEVYLEVAGMKMPKWPALLPEFQRAWIAVAQHVRKQPEK